MKKTGIFFLFIALIISINVVSANCAFQRLYWGAGTAVENTDVMINIQVKGDTCQGKIVTLSVKEYDHGLADDPVSIQPASVIIGSNSPPDGSWVFAGGTWKTQWQEDTDHPGETNPPEYYLVGALDGQTFSSQDHLNVLNNQYLNVTKYVAPPQNNSTCIDSDLGINYNVSGGVYGQLINGTNYSYSDVCANSSRLTEWFCSNGVAQSNTGNYCNNGCENGACKINLSNSVDNSTNKTNITVKQEALDAIDKAQQKLQVFKSKVGNYSLFYRQSIENAVDIAGLDQRIADFRRAYNSSNSSVDYRRVINLTNALNIPKSISTTETAKQILFFPDKNVFEPGVIAVL
ncbi:hypothetical protein HYT23_05280 [Candidatus Pacearchaeota archaeon]|nr:hypothetical protein [Candidatus Pacearchaeota archaeon]